MCGKIRKIATGALEKYKAILVSFRSMPAHCVSDATVTYVQAAFTQIVTLQRA
jgi:hypothetical protein